MIRDEDLRALIHLRSATRDERGRSGEASSRRRVVAGPLPRHLVRLGTPPGPTLHQLIQMRMQSARAGGKVGPLHNGEPTRRTDGADFRGPSCQAIVRRTPWSVMSKERNVQSAPYLQQELVDLQMRERLAMAEQQRTFAQVGAVRRGMITNEARRTIGRIVIHLGAWLAGERWEPAASPAVPVLKAAP